MNKRERGDKANDGWPKKEKEAEKIISSLILTSTNLLRHPTTSNPPPPCCPTDVLHRTPGCINAVARLPCTVLRASALRNAIRKQRSIDIDINDDSECKREADGGREKCTWVYFSLLQPMDMVRQVAAITRQTKLGAQQASLAGRGDDFRAGVKRKMVRLLTGDAWNS